MRLPVADQEIEIMGAIALGQKRGIVASLSRKRNGESYTDEKHREKHEANPFHGEKFLSDGPMRQRRFR
jgi:hypothetical protein